ncbi:protein kinase domain-containing protein [Sorangium sp. So ce131]|uniref:serine/threonine-protein kinase n=1 Tax=Sorangium sp. So ce131 TaxID=3133282 RepID=UPI003F5F2016
MSFVYGLSQGIVVLGRYRLDAVLGRGGMSVVWSATNLATRRRVALKFLKRAAPRGSRGWRRLAREARAHVEHPHVVGVIDLLEIDASTPVLVMELLHGRTLRSELRERGSLSLQRTADLLCPVMAAVGHVHALGFVHRDLKPENIFVLAGPGERPGVKVIDFGVVKCLAGDPDDVGASLTTEGTAIGTVGYAAPEQGLGGKEVDGQADVWSLGVVLHECLTGARPVPGDTWAVYLEASLRRGAVDAEELGAAVPPEVGALIDRMLAPRREERPTVREVFERLRVYSSDPDAPFALPAVTPLPARTRAGASGGTTEPDPESTGSVASTRATTVTEEGATPRAGGAPAAREGGPASAWRRRAAWGSLLAGCALATLATLSLRAPAVPKVEAFAPNVAFRMPLSPAQESRPPSEPALSAVPAPAATPAVRRPRRSPPPVRASPPRQQPEVAREGDASGASLPAPPATASPDMPVAAGTGTPVASARPTAISPPEEGAREPHHGNTPTQDGRSESLVRELQDEPPY